MLVQLICVDIQVSSSDEDMTFDTSVHPFISFFFGFIDLKRQYLLKMQFDAAIGISVRYYFQLFPE